MAPRFQIAHMKLCLFQRLCEDIWNSVFAIGRFCSPRIDRRVVLLRSICECIPARPEAPTDPGGLWGPGAGGGKISDESCLGHLGTSWDPEKTPTKWSHHDIMILKKHLRMKFGWFDSVRRNWRYCGLCKLFVRYDCVGPPSKKKHKREGNVGNTGSAGKWQKLFELGRPW